MTIAKICGIKIHKEKVVVIFLCNICLTNTDILICFFQIYLEIKIKLCYNTIGVLSIRKFLDFLIAQKSTY